MERELTVTNNRFTDLIPPLHHTREPLTVQSFLHYLLPPILCYYVTAVLVLLPETLHIRLAVLPLTLWMTFRGATRVDTIVMFNNDRLIYWNQGLVLILMVMGMRAIAWSFQRKPFRRVTVTTSQVEATQTPSSIIQLAIDAFELILNLRGCGWNWSKGLKLPPETRPTSSTAAFILSIFISLILYTVIFDVFHYSVQWFSPLTLGSAKGGTIFDLSIPFAQRYLRSSTITFLSGLTIYGALQVAYHVCTLLGVLVFRQHILLWPPMFKDPWFATSLTEFWAECWHQLFRDNFVSLGGKPMAKLFGRVGGVLGSFLISGVMHHLALWGMDNGSDFLNVAGFFVMMGVGIIMEHTLRRFTGRRVGGFFGWIWTVIWVIGWGHMLVEAYATHGLIGSAFFPRSLRPAFHIFGPLP